MSTHASANAAIREHLLAQPDSRLCGLGGCEVITQGGDAGLRRHREVCHLTDDWARAD